MVDGSPVTLTLQTDFPKSENIRLTVESKQPVDLYVRIPAGPITLRFPEKPVCPDNTRC